MAAACLAAVEAEEALLQIYALQWRAIDLRAQQLRAECRRVALDEEIDREERELLREHEQLLRMREKQLAQQKYEDAFALRAEVRRLRRQSDALQQRQESQAEAAAVSTTTADATDAALVKRKKKKAVVTKQSDKASSSGDNAAAEKTKKKETAIKKSVAFSPRKPPAPAQGARPRRLEQSFDAELEADAEVGETRKAAATKTAADELMQMLSQDKGSESEGDEVSLANLLPTFSSGGRSPSRAESATGTPSKFTPSKLARSVVKKAMAAPIEFDFTRKAALAKAKAAKEKQQQQAKAGSGGDDSGGDDAPTEAETPSKKALKRRKDLGISFADKIVGTTTKPPVTAVSTGAAAVAQNTGAKSLMQMIGVASLVGGKAKETSAASGVQAKAAVPAKKQPGEQAKPTQKTDKPAKEKTVTTSSRTEPEAEDFAGLQTANITKRAKLKKTPTASAEPEDEDAVADSTAAKSKPLVKKKVNAVEQAIAEASLLSRMPSMQDIETPKVAAKKAKTLLKKPAMTSLAAKRAEFQKILSDGVSGAAKDSDDDDGAEAEPDAFATPQKSRTMKRKRAEDLPAPAPPQTNYLQSPSVSALLAMRPSKSPIGIRYVPKTLKTPQMVPTAATRGALASAGSNAWSGSGPSFFDKFVNDGGLRLKRTVKP